MPIIKSDEYGRHLCPFNNFQRCLGSLCMAWVERVDPFQRTSTDNLITVEGVTKPHGEPKQPKGNGWIKDGPEEVTGYYISAVDNLLTAKAQRWERFVGSEYGKCGRVISGGEF